MIFLSRPGGATIVCFVFFPSNVYTIPEYNVLISELRKHIITIKTLK